MMPDKARVAVITGASAGVGKAAAESLAAQGWHVIATGRNPARCAQAEAQLRAAAGAGGGRVDFLRADLALFADVERLAKEIAALTDRVHLLANNAGGMPARKELTAEGFEANFAGNHLGPFLLTQRLLPLLRAAAGDAPAGTVRIVNTSSDGSEMISGLNFDDLKTFETWDPGLAYCSGKLANVLHARGLAGRLAEQGIVAHAFHPGTIDSCFFDDIPESTRAYTDTLEKLPAAAGAETLLWLATSEEAGRSSGGYWYQCQPRTANPVADDPAQVERLWQVSEALLAAAGH